MEASKAAHCKDKHRHAMHARVRFGFVVTMNSVGLLDIGF